MRPDVVCVLVIVIVMVAWPRFADAVSVYVNAAALFGLVGAGYKNRHVLVARRVRADISP